MARRKRAAAWGFDAIPGPSGELSQLDVIDERTFQQRVELLAKFYGWTPYHTFDSRRSAKGFLDLAMYRWPEDRGESYLRPGLGVVSEALYRDLTGDHHTPALGDNRTMVLPEPGCEVLFAELKVGTRKLTPEQTGWLDAFTAAGMEAYEWRWPESVPFICERLARGRVRIDPEWALGLV